MFHSDDEIDLDLQLENEQIESDISPKRFAYCKNLSQYYDKERKTAKFSDITIKVQTEIYHLNKVMLALKSGYFEKLFVGDFEEKKSQEIEISMMTADTFSTIVEIIYTPTNTINPLRKISSIYETDVKYNAIKNDDLVSVFIAMDYLQMEINLDIFRGIIQRIGSSLDTADIFKLYDYVTLLPEYESLLNPIYSCFSNNLMKMSELPEFLSITSTALIKILTDREENPQEKRNVEKICATWICHDIQNRLASIADLVNAVRYRFRISFAVNINSEDFNDTKCFTDEKTRQERVEKYFYKLMNYSAELSSQPSIIINSEPKRNVGIYRGNDEPEDTIIHKTNLETKWKEFLTHKNFCDVSVKVGEDIFHLHRLKLSSNIPYFHDLFTAQKTKRYDEYSLDAAIDATSFRKIIIHVYHEDIDVINERQIGRLLEACKILRMQKLIEKIYKHFRENLEKVKSNIFDLVSFVFKDENFLELCNGFEICIGNSWNEICYDTKFYELSIEIAEWVIALPNLQLFDEPSILNVCSKWILYDVKNRYKFIPELALAINRNCTLVYEQFNVPMPEDSSTISEKHIQDQLDKILTSTQLLPSSTVPLPSNSIETPTPCFITPKNDELRIIDAEFNVIMSIPFLKLTNSRNLSAAIIEDNLFILFHNQQFSFLAVNLVSRKITSLTCDPSQTKSDFHLLNCNNELYFGANRYNTLSKYSKKLNRWIQFTKNGENKELKNCKYASDGKVLYRVFKNTDYFEHNIQLYDFKIQSWVDLPKLPIQTINHVQVKDVSMVNGNLCVLFCYCTAMLRKETQKWEIMVRINVRCNPFEVFKQVQDNILYVNDSKELWQFSIVDKSWQFKNKLEKANEIIPIHTV